MEGVSWDMKDGKHVPKDFLIKGFKDNWGEFVKKTGIRHWSYFIKNGNGTDGTPFNVASQYEKSDVATLAYKNLGDTYYDTADFEGVNPAGGTPEALISQKVSDIQTQMIPKLIYAKTEAEAVSTYNKMISDMDAAGAAKIEKIINDNYKKKQDLWK